MRKLISAMLLVLLFHTLAAAASSVWKAEKGDSVIYLGGTFHMLRDKDYPLPPEFQQAYAAADLIVFETDIGQLNDVSMQQKVFAKARYADGVTIDRYLSARTMDLLTEYCRTNGIPLHTLKQFKPSLIMVAITMTELIKVGVSKSGVDKFYYEQAVRAGKQTTAFETVEQQIEFSANMADGHEDAFVLHALDDLKHIRQQFEELVGAWRSGNEEQLERLMVRDFKSRYPALYRRLIVDRNRNWMPLIDKYLQTDRVEFVMVGAGHLVGQDGIIEKLRQKGYRVEQL